MYNSFQNPLITRYASKEMSYVFSPENKYKTWRKLWIALAEAEKDLGLGIEEVQINEMKDHLESFDFDRISIYEEQTRHEVIAHIKAWADLCPRAKPIIHLGATSAFVMDNGDLLQMFEGLKMIKRNLVTLIHWVSDFALKYKGLPTLGYTHFQPAQLTTVGKRAAIWIYDLVLDYEDLKYRIDNFKLRGVKGTVGTQDSFMKLFNNDQEKVKELEEIFSEKIGFTGKSIPISGQTYSRKIDYFILSSLSNIAQSAHKIATDIRLLQGYQEIEEPFEEEQVGSSAMPYKRNPMRSERICSLSRFVIQMAGTSGINHSVQWLERSLDDSANRRIVIPEIFLAIDAILLILMNIFQGLKVNQSIIKKRIREYLPFLSAEYIIMESVKQGGDRQEVHALIRDLAMEAIKDMKEKGKKNTLIERLLKSQLGLDQKKLSKILDPLKMIGRSVNQIEEFINKTIKPILKENKNIIKQGNDFIKLKV